jgi:hypothetical protein
MPLFGYPGIDTDGDGEDDFLIRVGCGVLFQATGVLANVGSNLHFRTGKGL